MSYRSPFDPVAPSMDVLIRHGIAKSYRFFSDPGHGWLRVEIAELIRLNLLDKITCYSYMKGKWAYLEEDCDASTFLKAKKNNHESYIIKESNANNSSTIRTYPHFQASRIDA